MAKTKGKAIDPIQKKVGELKEKYGELAKDVAQEVLNNIPMLSYYSPNREIWMRIIKQLETT